MKTIISLIAALSFSSMVFAAGTQNDATAPQKQGAEAAGTMPVEKTAEAHGKTQHKKRGMKKAEAEKKTEEHAAESH